MKALLPKSLIVSMLVLCLLNACKKGDTAQVILVSPANNSTNVPTNQVFICDSVTNASTYTFTFTPLNGSSPISQSVVVPRDSPVSLLSGVTYQWTVTVTTTDNRSLASPTWSFSTAVRDTVPVLQQPANNATDVCPIPTFTWTPVTGGSTYTIQIDTQAISSSTWGLFYTSAVSDTTFTLPASLLPTARYCSWVVSVGASGAHSDIHYFSTANSPTLQSPANNATGVGTTPTLTWSARTCATTYDIEVQEVFLNFNTVVSQTVSGTSFTVPSSVHLSPSSRYKWRVRATGDQNFSDYIYFTT